jgi:large subunit ribosomal protein L31
VKSDIHAKVNKVKFTCSNCGSSYELDSTIEAESVSIETCMNCHSFFTGIHNISKAGEAERFFKRQERSEQIASTLQRRSKTEKKAEKDQRRKEKLAQSVGIDMSQIGNFIGGSNDKPSSKKGASEESPGAES